MKESDTTSPDLSLIKKGVRVWIRVHDYTGIHSRLRAAEVLSVLQLPASEESSYIAVRYLDEGTKKYECVSLAQIESFI